MNMEGGGSGTPDTTLSLQEVLWALFNETLMNKGACLKTPVKCHQRQLCYCCCILFLRFYDLAVMLMCLALVGYRQRMWQHAMCVVAVTIQLCFGIVSCCAGSMVGQLCQCVVCSCGLQTAHV